MVYGAWGMVHGVCYMTSASTYLPPPYVPFLRILSDDAPPGVAGSSSPIACTLAFHVAPIALVILDMLLVQYRIHYYSIHYYYSTTRARAQCSPGLRSRYQ
jgi:hypothetical protein